MEWYILALITMLMPSNAVRLHKLFQIIDGYKSEHEFKGWLHVGNEYTVYLVAPKPHEKYLTYHLYESKNIPNLNSFKPKLLAISRIPVSYIKDQLLIYRQELHNAKYKDMNVVPGTQVKTLREWQIDNALKAPGVKKMQNKPNVLRSVL